MIGSKKKAFFETLRGKTESSIKRFSFIDFILGEMRGNRVKKRTVPCIEQGKEVYLYNEEKDIIPRQRKTLYKKR